MSILQKIKNTISGGPSKSDANFENSRKEFKYVGEYIISIYTSLNKRVKNLRKTFLHIDCVGKVVTKYYHSDHPLAANCIITNKLIENSFNAWNDLNQQNYEAVGRAVARVKSIKESISTRDQYLMDLENSDSKLKSLREKSHKDPTKIPAEENNNRLKRQSYQQKNLSVMQEMHQFFEEKNDIFDIPLMQIQESLNTLFHNIYNNLFESSELLQQTPPKSNPITNYLNNMQQSAVEDPPAPASTSPSYGNNAYQPYQPNPTPLPPPRKPVAQQQQQQHSPSPQQQVQQPTSPTLSGPPVDLDKPFEPFTKKKLLVHNDVMFPGHQQASLPPQPVTLKTAPRSNSFTTPLGQPQPTQLKAAPKSNSFTSPPSQQPLHTPVQPNPTSNQVAKSGSYMKPTPPPATQSSPPPANKPQNVQSGVLPSQVNRNAVRPVSVAMAKPPAPQPAAPQPQAPPQSQTQQPPLPAASRPKSIIQKPPPQIQRQPSLPQQPTANKPSVNLSSLSGSRSNSSSNLLPAENFARHRELYGPHKKFKLVPKLAYSVIGTYEFSYVAPNLQPDKWSIILPAPPTSLNQNVRSSGLEIYDHNQNWLMNGELLTTDYHYVFRALVPSHIMPPQDTGRLRGRFIIEADLYSIDMVETDQWEYVEPLSPEEFAFYTRPSKNYTIDDPAFLDFIAKNNLTIQQNGATGEPETPLCFAYRVNLFIHDNFTYNHGDIGWKPILTTIQLGKGDCGCLAMLYNSILRKSGVPARSVIGRGGAHAKENGTGPHCKSEVWIDNIGWMPVDVTWNLNASYPTTKYFGHDCGELVVFHIDEVINIETGISNIIHENAVVLQNPIFYANGSGNFEGVTKTDQWTVNPI